MTFGDALRDGTNVLKRHKCNPYAAREAEELLVFAAGEAREALLAHPERRLTARQRKKFLDAVRRRTLHEPVEYIVGEADFFGRKFLVTKETLVPRPATEILVEAALGSGRKAEGRRRFIDIGTGSGCIAITLALELPNAEIIATDASITALRVARTNAKRHGVSSRIRFYRTDLLPSAFSPSSPLPLYLIANLPYIPSADMKKLPPDVRLHEPRVALDGGEDGLDHYRRLLARLPACPLDLFFEILPEQYPPLSRLAKKILPGCRTKKVAGPASDAIGIHIENRP